MTDLPRYNLSPRKHEVLGWHITEHSSAEGPWVKWGDVSARLQQLEQEKASLEQENVRLCRALGAREIRVPQPAAPADAGEPTNSAEGDNPRTIHRSRTEEELRGVLSTLCHFVWHRELRPGEHMWSIPVDRERDFDCILSDGIQELVQARAALAETREALHQLKKEHEDVLSRVERERLSVTTVTTAKSSTGDK